MDAQRRIAVICLAGLGMIGAAAAYAAHGGDGPIDPQVSNCGNAKPDTRVDRISSRDVDAVAKAVLADPLLARLTDVTKLHVKGPTDDPKEPGVHVLPKAMTSPAVGRIAPIVTITLPTTVSGTQRLRVMEESGATDCAPPTRVWTQEYETDVASLPGVIPGVLVAQVDLDPVRVLSLTPNVVDFDHMNRVGERVYLVGSR